MDTAGPLDIAPAAERDVPLILELIHELAAYEKLSDEVILTVEALTRALFGPHPAAAACIARFDGEPAGFALYFQNFSTFLGKPGLYLEDLFVRPSYRGRGIGKALLRHLARLAVARGYGRFEWAVLDWNSPARDFYEALGAQAKPSWITYRLVGDALRSLAGSAGQADAADY